MRERLRRNKLVNECKLLRCLRHLKQHYTGESTGKHVKSREFLDKVWWIFFRDAPALISTQATPAPTDQSERRTKVCATWPSVCLQSQTQTHTHTPLRSLTIPHWLLPPVSPPLEFLSQHETCWSSNYWVKNQWCPGLHFYFNYMKRIYNSPLSLSLHTISNLNRQKSSKGTFLLVAIRQSLEPQ